jgi:hypothetical protein
MTLDFWDLELLDKRVAQGCFMCRRIRESLDGEGTMQDHGTSVEGTVDFPVSGQEYHFEREREVAS